MLIPSKEVKWLDANVSQAAELKSYTKAQVNNWSSHDYYPENDWDDVVVTIRKNERLSLVGKIEYNGVVVKGQKIEYQNDFYDIVDVLSMGVIHNIIAVKYLIK